jgi:glycosyltransferase involved in cell wall biosynthesis
MTSALVPAKDEADRIASTLAALALVAGIDEVVVIDDGSTDDTATAAESAGARVVRLPDNRGKGAALAAGLAVASGDTLLLLDADLGATASQASLLLEPIARGDADLTIATFPRVAGRGGGVGLVVRLARWGIRRETGRVMEAPLSGQRAMRREVFERVTPLPAGFGIEVAMTIAALRAGYRVVEVPTQMAHRVTGRSLRAILHRARQFVAVATALRAMRGRRA